MEKLLKYFPFFALLYAGFTGFTLYEERELKIEGLEAQVATVQNEINRNNRIKSEVQEFHKNIELEKAKIDKVAQEIEKMQQLFPSEISDNENMSTLRGYANDVNMKEIQSISPMMDEDKGFYISRGYSFKARGTYLQFLILFEKIGESKRILNIRQVRFEKSQVPQKGKFQVIEGEFELETYKFNPNYTEEALELTTPNTPAV